MTFTSDHFRYDARTRTLTAFASDLGLSPGEFPRRIEIENRSIGVFLADGAERTADNELAGVRYRQANGPCFALILND